MYQVFDVISLMMVLWILYHVMQAGGRANTECLAPGPLALGCLILAALLHGDLNDRPIFDALWMCGLNASAVSVLPQLWMMTRNRTPVPALTSHFVAVMAFSRILSGTYM